MAKGGKQPGSGAPRKPEGEKTRVVSVSLSSATVEELAAEANRTGRSRSRIVEAALELYLSVVKK